MSVAKRMRAALEDPTVKSLFGKGLVALIIKVAAAGFGFLMFLLIARATNETEYGRFAVGFSLAITLSTVAGLGLGTAVLRFHSQYTAVGQTTHAHGFLRTAGAVTALFPLAVALMLVLAALVYKSLYPPASIGFLLASAVLLPVMAWSEFAASALRAFGYTLASMAPRDIIWRVLLCVFAAGLMVYGFQPDSTQVLLAAAAFLFVIVLGQTWHARSFLRLAFAEPSPQHDYPLWRKTALPMWGAATLYALAQQFDVVIVGAFMSATEAGPYFAALRTANMLSLLLIAGNLISAPLIAKYHHSGDRPALVRLIRLMTAAIALPTLLGFGLLVLIGEPLLALFNPAFVTGYAVMLVLAAGFTFDAIAGPTGYMLQMVGSERIYLKIMALAYAMTITLQLLLIPWFGAFGAAIPNALGLILANLLIIRAVKKTLGVDPSLLGLLAGRTA